MVKINLSSISRIDGERSRTINNKGQALIEILIGLMAAGIFISAATVAVIISMQSNLQNKNFQIASSLSQQLIDNIKTIAEADWHSVYNLGKGPATQYYVVVSSTVLTILPGTTTTAVGNITYTEFFSIDNVKRLNGTISADPSAVDDPSTQKIISYARWPGASNPEVALTVYLTRWRNSISRQTDWSGGSGQSGPISQFNKKFASSTGIDYSSSSAICLQGLSC